MLHHSAHYSHKAVHLFGRYSLLNIRLQVLGLRRAGPPVDDLSIASDQELLKVPLDPLHTQQTGLFVLEPLKRRVRFVAVDVDLAEHRERDAVVDHAELLDVVVGAWVLSTKLVAGEADDLEVVGVLGFDVLVELLEAGELGREAALGGRVHDEDDFALVVGKVVGITLLCASMRRLVNVP